MMEYLPEGILFEQAENKACLQSVSTLYEAMAEGRILEGRALLCGEDHSLTVDLGPVRGIMPRLEAAIRHNQSVYDRLDALLAGTVGLCKE